MSILIRGVRYPRSSPLTLIIYPDGTVSSVYDNQRGKAVPVLPHGRLGDLDKLIEKIDAIWDCNDMVFSPNDHCCNVPEDCKGCKWAETKNSIRRMVANAHTVIPASDGE